MKRLEGRNAVVTGGGRGIGEAIARALTASGASVVVAARSGEEIDRVARTLQASGARVVAIACDVTDEGAVARLAENAREALGEIDIVVNNAGAASSAPLAKLSLEEWNRLLAVNATGTFLVTRAFLPEMKQRGGGRVVNIASVSGLVGARYVSGYTAAKHAVVGFTRAVAAEVANAGVTVNAVCPGYVDTPMTERTIQNIIAKTGRSREAALASLAGKSGHGRLVTPEEVAAAVAYLASDEAASVNGHVLVLDGGGLAR